MSEVLKVVLATGWGVYLLVLAIWIILEKRSPQATIGWLLALGGLPVVGLLIYYFVGPRKLKRHRVMRGMRRQVLSSYRSYWKEQLKVAQQFYPQAKCLDVSQLPQEGESYAALIRQLDDLHLPHMLSQQARQLSSMVFDSTGLPISMASHYQLLEDGGQTIDAICEAIRAARHTVHLEYYIYEPDETGTMLRDLLTEKARAGVKVRLLVDWLGSRKITRKYMAAFIEAGGELAFFHQGALRWIRSVVNMRTHRKIVVCDGAVGFTGGVNVTDEEDLRRNSNAYHDLHLKFEGPAVYWLEQVFLEDWHYTTGEVPQDIPAPVPLEDVPQGKGMQVQVIASGPDTPQAPIWRAKLMAINAARHRVWLVTPYFVPDEPALFALSSAALRGLDVRLMVPKMSDSLVVTLAARSWYGELMAAGVRIWEYGPRMLHSKTLLVDCEYSFIGTDNFDNRSFRLNFEVAVLSYEHTAAQALEQQFMRDMLSARELHASDLKVPFWQQLPEDIARLGAPLL
ncbi:Major cardiolipin synthase ClsA [Saezia sanguinis]|uniref:Cardiolipin synthase n=1 Tax=Saezia sanguinis TaxID=1965230 RepID=A0A433SCE4_9BURK|nr:cardiolipin synthase [Saezia sanguinis]RUS66413.1 Major cardiolipin synthase ClsA [Saezia sanguinis]